jgi:hypothetical protein
MRKKATGFYADSLEMLLDTMCNVLGGIVFLTLVLAQLVHNTPAPTPEDYQRQSTELSRELAALTASNELVQAQTSLVIERLQNAQPHSHTNHLRLPQIGTTSKEPWEIIVYNSQLYPLNYLAPNVPRGLTANTRTISRSPLPGGRERVEPKPNQGEDPESGMVKMVETFRRLSKTNIYFTFHVYADSFAAFNRVEETVTRLAFQYGWEPLEQNTVLQVGGPSQRVPPQN